MGWFLDWTAWAELRHVGRARTDVRLVVGVGLGLIWVCQMVWVRLVLGGRG